MISSTSTTRGSILTGSVAWRNWRRLRGLDAEELEFVWKLQQDMLKIGSRIHRPNADKRCREDISEDRICIDIQTRRHLFIECESVKDVFRFIKNVKSEYFQNLFNNFKNNTHKIWSTIRQINCSATRPPNLTYLP